jgi:hypothetical protein
MTKATRIYGHEATVSFPKKEALQAERLLEDTDCPSHRPLLP